MDTRVSWMVIQTPLATSEAYPTRISQRRSIPGMHESQRQRGGILGRIALRRMPMSPLPRTLIAALMLACTGWAAAADIRVLTAGAYKPVVEALKADFERQTGHRLTVQNDTAGAIQRRIGGGEGFDVVVATPAVLTQLTQAGHVTGNATRLARVAIGVAVKLGAPAPDVSTVAAFQATLLSARAVATIDPAAGGSSGIYLWQLFEKQGIAAQLKPKAVLVPGGLVAEKVVSGEADIAIHQISEILAVPGARLVGPIPTEIQNYTVYVGGVSAKAGDAAAARAFIEALASQAAKAVLASKGMELP
jgi:molybdate transport system substrate-binding protein